jgi:hypothetical protein
MQLFQGTMQQQLDLIALSQLRLLEMPRPLLLLGINEFVQILQIFFP